MREVINPPQSEWAGLCGRPTQPWDSIEPLVREVFTQVERDGDQALRTLTQKFDGVKLTSVFAAILSEKTEAKQLAPDLKAAIDTAYCNIRTFHCVQSSLVGGKVETQLGVICWREPRAIERVGLYVPGGSAPLISTMLMLGVPAQLAGCRDVVVCTPPGKNGSVDPGIRYAAAKCGIRRLYMLGGAQAVAAMTVGTASVPKVDKIFGPGNQYVTAAKEYARRYGVAMDMPAGPSEVLVLADKTARADFVAADLLSQAEHGPDSQVVVVTNSRQLQNEVKNELNRQIRLLERSEIAAAALQNSLSIFCRGMTKCMSFANAYAPEHLILQVADAKAWAKQVINAGSVFVGQYTPESAGDYASGTNHTLPTAGWARTSSGLSVSDFQKTVSFQAITPAGLNRLAPAIQTLAAAEGLTAHARAVSIRQPEKNL